MTPPGTSGAGRAIVSFCVSLGQMRDAIRTAVIVKLSGAADVPELKLIALYMGDCSKNGSIRAKQLKFSG